MGKELGSKRCGPYLETDGHDDVRVTLLRFVWLDAGVYERDQLIEYCLARS